jgi:hypothetical protein
MANSKVDAADPTFAALKQREDLRDLLSFSLSDEFFRLRQRLGIAL